MFALVALDVGQAIWIFRVELLLVDGHATAEALCVLEIRFLLLLAALAHGFVLVHHAARKTVPREGPDALVARRICCALAAAGAVQLPVGLRVRAVTCEVYPTAASRTHA